jgi:hypothetical protein
MITKEYTGPYAVGELITVIDIKHEYNQRKM